MGEGGALAHVVVSLADGASLPAEGVSAPPALLDQKKCSYEPPALAARAGTTLEVRNSDPVMHTCAPPRVLSPSSTWQCHSRV